MKKSWLQRGTKVMSRGNSELKRAPLNSGGSQLKRTRLASKGSNENSLCKDRIQALLREIVMILDGGCFLRNFPKAGSCGGTTKSGKLILQAEHLITREKSISYGDIRNIVCLCVHHHKNFKNKHSLLYWDLVEIYIGPERWFWIKRVQEDTKTYRFTAYDWSNIEASLRQDLKKLKVDI